LAKHRVTVRAFQETDELATEERELIDEAPLAIEVAGAPPITIMRTPGHDRELIVGFLFTEGAVEDPHQIAMLSECPDRSDLIRVRLGEDASPDCLRRSGASVSACGLCGRESLEKMVDRLQPLPQGPTASVELLRRMPRTMRFGQDMFRGTGASHAVAAFSLEGEMLEIREDVGRHNALDKLIGWSLLAGRPLADVALMLSGRASAEMVMKSVAAGARIVASVSAPTSLAVELAERLNLTLAGFCRGKQGTLYAHAERITG
jgi:FdhD protein